MFHAYDIAGRLKTDPSNVSLTGDVMGVLPTANGGTSVDIASAALPLGSGQITFPATQNASSNANTLDDYEEGTWTPTFGGTTSESGQVYSSQAGFYVKVGRRVDLYFALPLSTLGTITGSVRIEGLPFVADATSTFRAVSPIFWVTWTTAAVLVQGTVVGNTDVIPLNIATAATTNMAAVGVVQADLAATSRVVGSLTYMTTG